MKKLLTNLLLAGTVFLNGSMPLKENLSFEQRVKKARTELVRDGITREQRLAYKPGISEIAYEGITPFGCELPMRKVKEFLPNLLHGRKKNPILSDREDAWRIYLGLPQESNTFGISEYSPSKSNDKNQKNSYYKIDSFWKLWLNSIEGKNSEEKLKNLARNIDSHGHFWKDDNVMGTFRMENGYDEKGSYISYHDKWDLNVPLERNGGFLGKPFEIYDRIYYTQDSLGTKQNKRCNETR